ncbi:MAG: hypothetical protein D3909_14405, partial [Candidatus Electrothrix sp. ATG1]|nr:hypothetical protein [Candidatus Electrothrix sp. ATG1]
MKQMKNGVAIGAVALFALTGCVADVAYVPQGTDSQPCVQGEPCEEANAGQQAAQQVAAKDIDIAQAAAPTASAPVASAPVASAPVAAAPQQYVD